VENYEFLFLFFIIPLVNLCFYT